MEKILNANIYLSKKNSSQHLAKTKTTNIDDKKLIEEILERSPQLKPADYTNYLNAVEDIKYGNYNTKTIISALYCLEASPFQISLLQSVYKLLKNQDLLTLLSPYQLTPSLTLGSLIKLATDQDYWAAYKNIINKQIDEKNLSCKNSEILITTDPAGTKHKAHSKKSLKIQKREVTFGTILLNEQKFIGSNLCHHYDLCDEWILVEGACKGYPERKVSKTGLSLDNTDLIISLFPDPEAKITYIRHGWTKVGGEDAKSELRNEYITRATGTYLVVIDADEFYEKEDLDIGINELKKDLQKYAIVFPQVHFWKTTENFITGEYYDISHTRIFRNLPGMKYIRNHNFPELNGKFVHELGQYKYPRKVIETKKGSDSYKYDGPKCYHMGFAKDFEDMKDKTEYYVNRGEGTTRVSTTNSRAAWFNGDLPEKCRVRNWAGDVPKFLKPLEKAK